MISHCLLCQLPVLLYGGVFMTGGGRLPLHALGGIVYLSTNPLIICRWLPIEAVKMGTPCSLGTSMGNNTFQQCHPRGGKEMGNDRWRGPQGKRPSGSSGECGPWTCGHLSKGPQESGRVGPAFLLIWELCVCWMISCSRWRGLILYLSVRPSICLIGLSCNEVWHLPLLSPSLTQESSLFSPKYNGLSFCLCLSRVFIHFPYRVSSLELKYSTSPNCVGLLYSWICKSV